MLSAYPPGIQPANAKSPIDRFCIPFKDGMFHCHIKFPEGNYSISTSFRTLGFPHGKMRITGFQCPKSTRRRLKQRR